MNPNSIANEQYRPGCGIIYLILICLLGLIGAPVSRAITLPFTDTFEATTWNSNYPLTSLYGALVGGSIIYNVGPSAALTTTFARSGSQSARITLNSNDQGYIYGNNTAPDYTGRSEHQLNGVTAGVGNVEERWYGISMYLDPPWNSYQSGDPNGGCIVAQWHTIPDPGEFTGKSPHLFISADDNRTATTTDDFWLVHVIWDNNQITVGPPNATFTKIPFNVGPLNRGRWVDWVVRARWDPRPLSLGGTGLLQVWKDGIQVVNYSGPNKYRDGTASNPRPEFLKFGSYKSPWQTLQPPSPVALVNHFDELRIRDASGTYAAVEPGQGAPIPPSGLAATVISSSQINLTWSDNSASPNAETAFRIERRVGTGSFSLLTNVAAGSTSYSNTGLSAGTSYTYRVRAENADGVSGFSNQSGATTQSGGTTLTIFSVAAQDGRVRESGETTNVGGGFSASEHYVGDNASRQQTKLMLSFDTSGIPDGATITSATLRMRRLSVTGTSPFSWGGQCRVDIRNGGFNGNVALQVVDFEAAASATNVAQMSNPTSNGAWSTGALNSTGRGQINKTGTSQLRVYFETDDNNNSTNDYMSFHGGEAAAGSRPELVVVYQ